MLKYSLPVSSEHHIRVLETDRHRLAFGAIGVATEFDSLTHQPQFQLIGATETTSGEPAISLTTPASESSPNDVSGRNQVNLRDDPDPSHRKPSICFLDHTHDPWFKQRFTATGDEDKSVAINSKLVPPYEVEDFGQGGAFPEIHVAQYPLDMGRNKSSNLGSKILPVNVDAHGNVAYDVIVKQNENAKKFVYTQHKDLIPKILRSHGER
ncbi:hypothetical protein RYX36_035364 [Vicia faba]